MTFLFSSGSQVTGFVHNTLIVSRRTRLPSGSSSNAIFTLNRCVSSGYRCNNSFLRKVAAESFLSSASSPDSGAGISEVELRIAEKGAEIRRLKAAGVSKDELAPHVTELLALKNVANPDDEGTKTVDRPLPAKKKKSMDKHRVELSDSETRQVRLEKALAMAEAGQNPYAYSFNPTHTAAELRCIYEGKLGGGEEDENADVTVAGRIMTRRVFGKLAFFTLLDESGTIQLQLDKKRLGDRFKVRKFVMPCVRERLLLFALCTLRERRSFSQQSPHSFL